MIALKMQNNQFTLNDHLAKFATLIPKNSKILDVGCGSKPYEKLFQNCSYLGIDVEVSGRNEKFADKFYDGINIPYPDEQFDAVICTQVLEHCKEPKLLGAQIHRVLKKDGLLLITVPFIWGEHETPYDFRRYSSFGIQKLILDLNFSPVSFSKVSYGIDAIRVLVNSEIHHSKVRTPITGFKNNLKIRIAERLWHLVLKLWKSLYQFDRIYLDNVIIAKKCSQISNLVKNEPSGFEL
jgi:SAM-dependent methyltransferase